MNLGAFRQFDRALSLVSAVCGFFYLITQSLQPFPGSVLLKALSVATLAALAFRAPAPSSMILGTALAFSSLGDALLDLGSNRFFIWGLLSFLVAHLIYILLFVRNRVRSLKPKGWQSALVAAVLINSILLSQWLAPNLGALLWPVMFYVCVITVMVVSAILAGFSRPWICIGAILFLISDSILAVNKFKSPVPMGGYLVWATYYLAQYGIAIGFLREKSGKNQHLSVVSSGEK
ncbi:MAG TPA: lysoplasmalogenase [Blastocatellia bacterium]|nr:lysoplasmalogenase [Blastocatellia bacterium]